MNKIKIKDVKSSTMSVLDCTPQEYHQDWTEADTGARPMSSSYLRGLLKGQLGPVGPSPSMALGTIVHSWIEGLLRGKEYLVLPSPSDQSGRALRRGSTAYKDFTGQLDADAGVGNYAVLTSAEYEKFLCATDQAESFFRDRQFLRGTEMEEKLQTELPLYIGSGMQDVFPGHGFKGLLDVLAKTNYGVEIVDFKTTSSSSLSDIGRQILSFRYVYQLALYSRLTRAVFDLDDKQPMAHALVFLSTKLPAAPVVVTIDPAQLDAAWAELGTDEFTALMSDEIVQKTQGARILALDQLLKFR